MCFWIYTSINLLYFFFFLDSFVKLVVWSYHDSEVWPRTADEGPHLQQTRDSHSHSKSLSNCLQLRRCFSPILKNQVTQICSAELEERERWQMSRNSSCEDESERPKACTPSCELLVLDKHWAIPERVQIISPRLFFTILSQHFRYETLKISPVTFPQIFI